MFTDSSNQSAMTIEVFFEVSETATDLFEIFSGYFTILHLGHHKTLAESFAAKANTFLERARSRHSAHKICGAVGCQYNQTTWGG
jgi:hypothetical protein